MGMFRDSPEEKHLRETVNNIASIAGAVCEGRISRTDLDDVWRAQRPQLQSLYDAVAAKHGPKAPRKILAASYDIANISGGRAGGAARNLMQEVLLTLDRAL